MKLVDNLRKDFPDILFEPGEENLWLPDEKKIIFCLNDDEGLLHELGHSLCGHSHFSQDIELLHSECDAWEKAKELSKKYGIKIHEERIEAALDWYRDWLHKRSICPNCGQNGVQENQTNGYYCINCDTSWQPSDGRKATLKRMQIKRPL